MGAKTSRTTAVMDETVRMDDLGTIRLYTGNIETVRMETIKMYSPLEFARIQVGVSRLHFTNGLNCTTEYWTIMQVK